MALLAPSTAARDEPDVLPASSAWVVDYADDSCALRRQFGGPDRSVVLELRQFAPGSVDYQYKLISDHYELEGLTRAYGLRVRYSPDADASDAWGAFNLMPDEGWRGVTFSHSLFERELAEFYRTNPDPAAGARDALIASLDQSAREQAVTSIEIRSAFASDILLQTGPMRAPMNAMRTCLDELLTHWGIDAEAHRSLRQRAIPMDMTSWARRVQQVYPLASRGEQAVLRIRLAVSVEGRVTDCHMQERMGQEAFERSACNILQRHARFTPALDAQGNPIASFYPLVIYYSVSG